MVAGQETTHRLIENYLEQIDPGKRTIYTGLIPVLDSIIFTSRKLMCDQFGNRAISDQTSREITGMEFLSEVLEDLDSTHSLKHAGNQIPSTAVTQLILSCYTEALVSDLFTEHFDIAHFDEQKKRICALFARMIPGQIEAISILRTLGLDSHILLEIERKIRSGKLKDEISFNDLWSLIEPYSTVNGSYKMDCAGTRHWRLIESERIGLNPALHSSLLGVCSNCLRGLALKRHSGQRQHDANGCMIFASRLRANRNHDNTTLELTYPTQRIKPAPSGLSIFGEPETDLHSHPEYIFRQYSEYRDNWLINLHCIISGYQRWRNAHPNSHFGDYTCEIMPQTSQKNRKLIEYILKITQGMGLHDAFLRAEQIWDRNVNPASSLDIWQRARNLALIQDLAFTSDNPFLEQRPQESVGGELLIDPSVMLIITIYIDGEELPIMFPIKINRLVKGESKPTIYQHSVIDSHEDTNDPKLNLRSLVIGNAAIAITHTTSSSKRVVPIKFGGLSSNGFRIIRSTYQNGQLGYRELPHPSKADLIQLEDYLRERYGKHRRANTTNQILVARHNQKRYMPRINANLQTQNWDGDSGNLPKDYMQLGLF